MGEITKTHFSGQYLHRDRRKVSEVYFNERYRWKREDIFKKIQLMIIIVPPSLDKIRRFTIWRITLLFHTIIKTQTH